MAPLPPAVRELDVLLARRRAATATMLSMDLYERYGAERDTPENRAAMAREAARAGSELRDSEAQLTALVARLRGEEPEAVARWADVHDELLRAYIDTCPKDGTEVFVAQGERDGWSAVKRGEKAFVEENTYFVKMDPVRYAALFGFAPYPDR